MRFLGSDESAARNPIETNTIILVQRSIFEKSKIHTRLIGDITLKPLEIVGLNVDEETNPHERTLLNVGPGFVSC